jgi:hypothetical protein
MVGNAKCSPLYQKNVPTNMVKGSFWKFFKKKPYLKEKNYEIAKIFGILRDF